jgi:uncharacterized protein (DUF1810 family)
MNLPPNDPFNLARFVEAQSRDYETALGEIRAGRKRSHWIWYILPQLSGLGSSRMSVTYGITGIEEARAYLAHPVLGVRLRECVEAMLASPHASADQILGDIDAMKFRSCITLFRQVEAKESCFDRALGRFFAGKPDSRTLDLLAQQRRSMQP